MIKDYILSTGENIPGREQGLKTSNMVMANNFWSATFYINFGTIKNDAKKMAFYLNLYSPNCYSSNTNRCNPIKLLLLVVDFTTTLTDYYTSYDTIQSFGISSISTLGANTCGVSLTDFRITCLNLSPVLNNDNSTSAIEIKGCSVRLQDTKGLDNLTQVL